MATTLTMKLSPGFFKFAGICAVTTALTTLAIHLLPELWSHATTFEKQLKLRENPVYLFRLWVVIIHCILVVVSMYAIRLHKIDDSPVLIGLGFLSFVIFAFCELLRTSLVIFALNRRWRAGYVSATDESVKEGLRSIISSFSGVGDALFFLFFVAFFLGTLCYGYALIQGEGADRKIGMLLLLWAGLNIPTLIDTVRGIDSISRYFEWTGPYFQPVARALIGIWIYRLGIARSDT